MSLKDREAYNAYQRSWYAKNKDNAKSAATKRRSELRKRNRAFVRELKSQPCVDCGQSFHYSVMDFDHLRDKKNVISALMGSSSIETLETELAKCELVCANCHRYRTWLRTHSPVV